jgi:valyl-tRNA synthetase
LVAPIQSCAEKVTLALQQFRVQEAAMAVQEAIWQTLCDWGVEFAKDRLAQNPNCSETAWVLRWAVGVCAKLLHPFMPFLSQAMWAQLWGPKVSPMQWHLASPAWPGLDIPTDNLKVQAVNVAQDLIGLMRRVRQDFRLDKTIQPWAHVQAGEQVIQALKDLAPLVSRWTGMQLTLEAVPFTEGHEEKHRRLTGATPPKGCLFVLDSCQVWIDLQGLVDVDQESNRISEAIAKYQQEIQGLDVRLGDEECVAKTPEEVVDEWRARRDQRQAAMALMTQMLQGLRSSFPGTTSLPDHGPTRPDSSFFPEG